MCRRHAAMPRKGEELIDSYDSRRTAWGWRSDRGNILPWSTTSFRARRAQEQRDSVWENVGSVMSPFPSVQSSSEWLL